MCKPEIDGVDCEHKNEDTFRKYKYIYIFLILFAAYKLCAEYLNTCEICM